MSEALRRRRHYVRKSQQSWWRAAQNGGIKQEAGNIRGRGACRERQQPELEHEDNILQNSRLSAYTKQQKQPKQVTQMQYDAVSLKEAVARILPYVSAGLVTGIPRLGRPLTQPTLPQFRVS